MVTAFLAAARADRPKSPRLPVKQSVTEQGVAEAKPEARAPRSGEPWTFWPVNQRLTINMTANTLTASGSRPGEILILGR